MSELVGLAAALRVGDVAADLKHLAAIQGVHNQSLDARFQRLETWLAEQDARLRVIEAAPQVPSPEIRPLAPAPPDPVAALESMTNTPDAGEGPTNEA